MKSRLFTHCLIGLTLSTLGASLSKTVSAQGTRGFDTTVKAVTTGEERQRQPDLWQFDVSYKPMRMVWVNVTDPRTGKQTREQIWYLAYRAQNRSIASRDDIDETTPVNTLDPLPGPAKFLPSMTLVTYGDRGTEIPDAIYLDQVIPEAAQAINDVERRRPADPVFLDSVQVIQDLPEAVPADDQEVVWIHGVATWSNVDPETDYFKVVLSGFSNGYELRPGPDGTPITWRKQLVQRFSRRGDRFDPSQIEFEVDGPPEWTYLPDPATARAAGNRPGDAPKTR